jgi:hypothetical protein
MTAYIMGTSKTSAARLCRAFLPCFFGNALDETRLRLAANPRNTTRFGCDSLASLARGCIPTFFAYESRQTSRQIHTTVALAAPNIIFA